MKDCKNIKKASVGKNGFFTIIFIISAFLVIANFYQASVSEAKTYSIPESFTDLAKMASPAVVNIRTVKTIKGGGRVYRHFFNSPFGKQDPFNDFFDKFLGNELQRDFKQRSLGSGFIIDKEGYIVTNNHVVEDADKIKVKLKNGKEFDAEIVGRDPNTDIALIKIKSKNNLPVVKLGDSDALQVGQWVVAIGSPFGLEHTVTAGIVSAKGRIIGSGPYDDFLQTDASINPGNSGGPLINMEGEVIGINTAIIASGQGIGFAIPINHAKRIVDQLKSSGEVTRGWLGVGIQDLSEELAEYYGIKEGKGVLVTEVFPGDPADEAGIKPKDIVLYINGKRVENTRELSKLIADTSVGDTVKIKVLRNGIEKTFPVKIVKRVDEQVASQTPSKGNDYELGVRVSELTPEIVRHFNINEAGGIIVIDVEPESQGAQAGVMVGDIIKEINHQPITTVKDYKKEIKELKKGDSILMFIKRINAGYVVVKLTK
ncbi:MAG: DegQ family serine endoprotease [Proteobacteria bacterium]|nr:DegQ family serine endoprotease [Pseudomonadota bacterium]MBU3981583.1 DegQ family serine endoprotease [Pseudomonadota bacterium]MBU4013783.1 DegQ family serine endoprotease [Pseudomonadota bacterium]MBU4067724.1 DegQ family serine endoprotease [Pseudomonadota bacterium]MBU4127532.1 DegQ family serine endoprotease [Pseudomonadota bacterium]